MAKIIIDISLMDIEAIKELGYIPQEISEDIAKSINDGTILPDDARFINADEIIKHAHIEEDDDGDIFVKKWYCIEKNIFDNALVTFDTYKESEGWQR